MRKPSDSAINSNQVKAVRLRFMEECAPKIEGYPHREAFLHTLAWLTDSVSMREDGRANRGVFVDAANLLSGAGYGAPWCASFISLAIYLNWGLVLGSAHVQTLWRVYPGARVKTPRRGDLGLMFFGKGTGHIFAITAVGTDRTLRTLEGNTDADGGREGHEAARRTRTWTKVPLGNTSRFLDINVLLKETRK
jgi:hypothetical protein